MGTRFQAGPEPAVVFVELADQLQQPECRGVDMCGQFGDFVFDFGELAGRGNRLKDCSEVHLGPEDGVPRPCAVNCDHLQTVSKARLGKLITRLPAERMQEVGRTVSFALDF